MKLHLLCGIPGSGKSTLGKKLKGYVVSTDSIRKFLWQSETVFEHDVLVFDLASRIMEYLLLQGEDVVFDATNLRRRDRRKFIQLAEKHQAQAYIHWVNSPLAIAIRRNACRERKVPVPIIQKYQRTLQKPSLKEGVNRIKIYNPDLRTAKVISSKGALVRILGASSVQ